MRVCFCIDRLGNGGAERVVSILANEFCVLGYDVYLIETSTKKWDSFYKIDDGVKRICLLDTTSNNRRLNKIKALAKSLRTISPDIIISFKYQTNINVFLANLKLKIPHIVSERNNPYTYDIGLSSKILKKYIFKHANGCVFQTEDARRFYFKKESNKTTLINNPLILKSNPGPYKRLRHKTILYVGRLDAQKNVKLLIDSFNKVFLSDKDYILKIYGCGPLDSQLKEYVSTLSCKNSVLFLGASKTWQEDEKNSMIFVLPSNYEGMPNSLMEALALGIPCIATDCPIGGSKILIKNGINGSLVPCNDCDALVSAMLDLMNDENKRNLYAKNNEDMHEKYAPRTIANKWIEFIEKILGNK